MAVRGHDAGGAALGDGREQGRPVGVVREHESAVERALPPDPRTRMRPEAKASEWTPSRRIHGVPRAESGASTSSPENLRPLGCSVSGIVGSMRTPASR